MRSPPAGAPLRTQIHPVYSTSAPCNPFKFQKSYITVHGDTERKTPRMQTDANGCKRMQTDANACKWMQTHANGCKRMQMDANGCKRMHSHSTSRDVLWPVVTGCRGIPRNAAGYHGIPRYTAVSASQENALSLTGRCGIIRVCRQVGAAGGHFRSIVQKRGVIACPIMKCS